MSEVPYEPVPPPANPPPPGYGAYPPPPSAGGLSENTAAALAYVTFIPAVLFLVLEPYKRSHFIRFHAFQCIMLTVASVVIHLVLGFIPFFGWVLSAMVSLVFLILWLIAIVNAAQGKWFKLPVIGDLALEQSRV